MAGDKPVNKSDKDISQYARLLRQAEIEGRLDGDYQCEKCGMKYVTREEAVECCGKDSECD